MVNWSRLIASFTVYFWFVFWANHRDFIWSYSVASCAWRSSLFSRFGSQTLRSKLWDPKRTANILNVWHKWFSKPTQVKSILFAYELIRMYELFAEQAAIEHTVIHGFEVVRNILNILWISIHRQLSASTKFIFHLSKSIWNAEFHLLRFTYCDSLAKDPFSQYPPEALPQNGTYWVHWVRSRRMLSKDALLNCSKACKAFKIVSNQQRLWQVQLN